MYKVFVKNAFLYLRNTPLHTSEQQEQCLYLTFHSPKDIVVGVTLLQQDDKMHGVVVYHQDIKLLTDTLCSLYPTIHAGGGLVKNRHKECLLIFRRGKWDLPKGKQDTGETLAETAVREVCEETGIQQVTLGNLLHDTYYFYDENGNTFLKHVQWYEMQSHDDLELTPQTEEGIEEVRWFNQTTIQKALENTYPLVKEIIENSFLK